MPIAFGYDLPWMSRCYRRPDLLAESYRLLGELMRPAARQLLARLSALDRHTPVQTPGAVT